MARIKLRIYRNPGKAEAFLTILNKDGAEKRITIIVDTGAEVTLLPDQLMNIVDYRLSKRGQMIAEQAGIAQHIFEVTEAFVMVHLEDEFGGQTDDFEIPVWFADTTEALPGFDGILDRAVLHLDMPKLNGYLELN